MIYILYIDRKIPAVFNPCQPAVAGGINRVGLCPPGRRVGSFYKKFLLHSKLFLQQALIADWSVFMLPLVPLNAPFVYKISVLD